MRMLKCDNGHYYDDDKYQTCPYCIKESIGSKASNYLRTMIEWVNQSSVGHAEIADLNQKSYATKVDSKKSSEDDTFDELILENGDIFGRYIIDEKIASGGFSNVYRASHKHLKHSYALKIFKVSDTKKKEKTSNNMTATLWMTTNQEIKNDSVDISELKKMFFNEAKSLAALTHPNVVNIFDVGVIKGRAYILLEYIEKERLDAVLNDVKKFTVDKTLNLLEDIASVLVMQEEHNIIHSDIKPQNIFLRKNNTFCLIDYGNMNSDNIIAYTKEYASPEHRNRTLTHQSDLYQLGLIAWQCLSGEVPKDSSEWDFNIPSLLNYRDDIPSKLVKIIDNLLQKELLKRYKTAKDLLDDIHLYRYYKEEPIGAIQGTIFVAISYSNKFFPVFNKLNQVANKINFKCIRMDRLHFQDEIWRNIALEIEHSDIIIADFSKTNLIYGANSNVITEASHARAKGKKIIIITQNKPEKLPFDWRYLPAIQYSVSKKGLDKLAKDIHDRLRVLVK